MSANINQRKILIKLFMPLSYASKIYASLMNKEINLSIFLRACKILIWNIRSLKILRKYASLESRNIVCLKDYYDLFTYQRKYRDRNNVSFG